MEGAITLDINSPDGSPLEVKYRSNYINDVDHIELRGASISSTGYRSHFIMGGTDDPTAYAIELVAHLFKEQLKQGYKAGQLSLI